MYKQNDKRRLYWLIDQYLLNAMNAWQFSNEYHDCYDIALDLHSLTKREGKLFSELSIIAARFSPFKEDHQKYPGVYYTEDDLKYKTIKIKEKLKYENNLDCK